MLRQVILGLLFSTPIAAKYLTITAGSSEVTETQCQTLVASSSIKSVPTYSLSRHALLPQVVLALAVSTPASTSTPPAVTVTDTSQTFITITTIASSVTSTFSTTSTIFETESLTNNDTIVSTTTSTTTSTSTTTYTEPVPSNWVSAKNSTGLKEREDHAAWQYSDLQQPLQDDGLETRVGWPPKIPSPPGGYRDPWINLHPFSVTCFYTVRTHYIKIVIFVQPYTTTTTIPPATSTTTSIQIVSTTSTIVPDRVSVTESFSTTTTTTTILTSVVTDTSTATELVNATSTTTSYAACFTENVVKPKLENDNYIIYITTNDQVGQFNFQNITDPYDCCVSCLLSDQNCQYNTEIYDKERPVCGRVLNPAICRGQDFDAGKPVVWNESENPGHQALSASNGPCGTLNGVHQGAQSL